MKYSHQTISRLSKRRNDIPLLHIMIRLFFHTFCITIGLFFIAHNQYFFAFLFFIPHFAAYSFLGWAGIGHELFHNTVFTSKKVNKILFILCSLLTWNNYAYFRVTHRYHHRNTLEVNDIEGVQHPSISKLNLVWFSLFDIPTFIRRIKVLILNSAGQVPTSSLNLFFFPLNSKKRFDLIKSSRLILIFQAGLFLIFVSTEQYWLILLINLAPFCCTILNRTLAISQHYSLDSFSDDLNSKCRTIHINKVLAFFYANMNFHTEHHLFPSIPYYNLPKINNELRLNRSLKHSTEGYWSTINILRKEGLFR